MPKNKALALSIALIAVLLYLLVQGNNNLPRFYFTGFDAFAAIAIVICWLAVSYTRPGFALPRRAPGGAAVAGFAVGLCVALWAGTYLVMLNYPVSRDEHMAVFDAYAFANGEIGYLLPPEWEGFAEAMAPAFLLETPQMNFMLSDYRPLNAGMRALVSQIGDPALTAPMLAGAGLVALWWIARRTFTEKPAAVWVALGAYVLSAQILTNAMTTYAMTGHVALNLIWLALFLKNRWWSHALAMGLGVIAMGLHQFVFHPLFAGPFILLLVWQRRWLAFLAYAGVYGAGVLLWMSWNGIVMDLAGLERPAGGPGGIVDFIETRIIPVLTNSPGNTLALMLYNLVRALAWNAVFVLPLVVASWPLLNNAEPRKRAFIIALFGGIFLTIFVMAVVLPYQGHGWGYRYLHALIGNFALLAGFGYTQWARDDRRAADGAVIVMGVFGAVVLIPAAMLSAHMFVKPHAELGAIAAGVDADFVIIDNTAVPNAVDEVRNWPDLSNRPLMFAASKLTPAQVATLCARGSVAVIGAREVREVGLPGIVRKPGMTLPDGC